MAFTASDLIKILVAIFLPPLGVFLERGCNADFFINILLTILGYIPITRTLCLSTSTYLRGSEGNPPESELRGFSVPMVSVMTEAFTLAFCWRGWVLSAIVCCDDVKKSTKAITIPTDALTVQLMSRVGDVKLIVYSTLGLAASQYVSKEIHYYGQIDMGASTGCETFLTLLVPCLSQLVEQGRYDVNIARTGLSAVRCPLSAVRYPLSAIRYPLSACPSRLAKSMQTWTRTTRLLILRRHIRYHRRQPPHVFLTAHCQLTHSCYLLDAPGCEMTDMDISAALTPDDMALFGVSDRPCEIATRYFTKDSADSSAAQLLGGGGGGGGASDGRTFEQSLRLKNTLDAIEEQARVQPSWELLSILVNCEYSLYVLNQATPLRLNPFLSHWVEMIQRLAKTESDAGRLATDMTRTDGHGHVGTKDINVVRTEVAKSLLRFRNPAQFAQISPRGLYEKFVELRQTISFDIVPYIQMLEEEGIYEKTSFPDQGPEDCRTGSIETTKEVMTPRRPKLSDFQQWKQQVLSRLESNPESAIQELTHLPIELSSLDFLTTLLQDNMLERYSIDPAPVISDYIQHSLRLTEQMGEPPDPASEGSFAGVSITGSNGNSGQGIGHGREAQTRAVKLLLLFIRNLIRKALLPPEAIYFEIQEICVRYVWIKEVRDFRSFIEDGPTGDKASA
ncbi:hypothetical protein K504DRAFT_454346 [Pleomassaria siparia CBS 279.74]|uniref:Uncharacterized protein n=1 Tax=Pleomassaria siparia CBS 279.74 TaxID=1314801 RepID=A0A6G1KC82_9PLEO|nr:hypothetical protein K504DRAFT_454346 [Pleomassaria siparia CBS 279.74]